MNWEKGRGLFKISKLGRQKILAGTVQDDGPFGIGIRIEKIVCPVGPGRNTVEIFIDVEDSSGKILATLDDVVVLKSGDTFHIQDVAKAFLIHIL